MHMFASGSPKIYYNDKNDLIYIGKDYYCDDEIDIALMEDGEDKGNICTELRWVTCFDYEIYKNIAIKKFGEEKAVKMLKEWEEEKQYGLVKFKVKPGFYRCTYFYENIKEYEKKPELFISMELIKHYFV